MRALSLWQPWASGIALGAKRIETRSWSTPYRGPIAIHAAKRWSGEQARAALRMAEDDRAFREAHSGREGLVSPAAFVEGHSWPRGCVVAVAELTACVPADGIDVADREGRWGDFTPGRFGWVLEKVQPLVRPYPLVGRQGLWTLSQEERDAVLALARGAR